VPQTPSGVGSPVARVSSSTRPEPSSDFPASRSETAVSFRCYRRRKSAGCWLGALATTYRDARVFRLCLSPEAVQVPRLGAVSIHPRTSASARRCLAEVGACAQDEFPISMPDTDYTARLRQLVEQCRRAARSSFEVEAKGAFRTIGEELSNMADELDRSGGSGERRPPGDVMVRTHL
jgi:hypothetical protein